MKTNHMKVFKIIFGNIFSKKNKTSVRCVFLFGIFFYNVKVLEFSNLRMITVKLFRLPFITLYDFTFLIPVIVSKFNIWLPKKNLF